MDQKSKSTNYHQHLELKKLMKLLQMDLDILTLVCLHEFVIATKLLLSVSKFILYYYTVYSVNTIGIRIVNLVYNDR